MCAAQKSQVAWQQQQESSAADVGVAMATLLRSNSREATCMHWLVLQQPPLFTSAELLRPYPESAAQGAGSTSPRPAPPGLTCPLGERDAKVHLFTKSPPRTRETPWQEGRSCLTSSVMQSTQLGAACMIRLLRKENGQGKGRVLHGVSGLHTLTRTGLPQDTQG